MRPGQFPGKMSRVGGGARARCGHEGYQRGLPESRFQPHHVSLLTWPCGRSHTDLECYNENGAEDDVSWGWVDGFQPFTWRRSHLCSARPGPSDRAFRASGVHSRPSTMPACDSAGGRPSWRPASWAKRSSSRTQRPSRGMYSRRLSASAGPRHGSRRSPARGSRLRSHGPSRSVATSSRLARRSGTRSSLRPGRCSVSTAMFSHHPPVQPSTPTNDDCSPTFHRTGDAPRPPDDVGGP